VISHIRGRLVSLEGNIAVVEAGGIGFSIRISPSAFHGKSVGKTVTIPAVLDISGGNPVLLGFRDTAERNDFSLLVKIPGIGPGTAIRLLPVAEKLKSGDLSALDGVPGLGPARRNKIARWLKKSKAEADSENPLVAEVREALVSLGMGAGEAKEKAVRTIRRKPGASLDQLIRLAVKG